MSRRPTVESLAAGSGRHRPGGTPLAVLVLAALVLAMFADVLLTRESRVLSSPVGDLRARFLHLRSFGFAQLEQGNLALWNPHMFGGAPFLGNFESALLYPPNWLYLLLPLHTAVNVGIALHVLILGLGMLGWGRLRGLSLPASLLAGVLAMFGSAHFMHIWAGHLSNLCTMAWAPLLLLVVDACLDRPALPWALAGALVVALTVLAGHPQYVFFMAVAAAVYAPGRLVEQAWRVCRQEGPAAAARAAGRPAGLLVLAALGGLALAAVQLLTGLDAATQGVRSGGLPAGVAGMFSLPPENLLTLIAPKFFGDGAAVEYWGRWYRWETTLFIGAAALVLAVCGAIAPRVKARGALLATLAVVLVLALGAYTPLYGLLHRHVPPFDRIRGLSKFVFHASLLLALLAGAGLDWLIAERRRWWPVCLAAGAGLAVLAGAAWVASLPAERADGPWRRLVASRGVGQAGDVQVYLDGRRYDDPAFLRASARQAARSLGIAGATLGATALLLALRRRWAAAVWAVALLAVLEVMLLAGQSRPTFRTKDVEVIGMIPFEPHDPEENRILNMLNPIEAMSAGRYEAWGHGPEVRRRYAELLFFAQHEPLENVSQQGEFTRWDRQRLYALVRLKHVLLRGPEGSVVTGRLENPMRRLHLVPAWRVLPDRDAIFEAMLDPRFDPRQTVFLERPPGLPEPVDAAAAAPGMAEVVESSTDHLVVHAELAAPAVLLITDAYDSAWRASALPGSARADYSLVPGDWALQAIPLTAGSHRIRLEYRPAAFVAGAWVSIAALALYAAAWAAHLARRRRSGKAAAGPASPPVFKAAGAKS